MLVEKEEDAEKILIRRIVGFRKVGDFYRRDDEIHHQKLYSAAEVTESLRGAGFGVRTMRSYGGYPLQPVHVAFVARKPV